MLRLFTRKAYCHHCGKRHVPNFKFGDFHFCSYQCWETFGLSLSLEEFIELDKYDRRINGW